MGNLGLNLQSFIINTAVFLGFFIFMHFLVLKKLGGVIVERQSKMQEADRRADETKHALERARSEFDKVIQEAKIEAQCIVGESKKQANDQAKKILERAQIDAGEIIIKAQGVLVVEKEKMLAEFRESLEKAVKESLTIVLTSQADKIDFDAHMLREVTVKP